MGQSVVKTPSLQTKARRKVETFRRAVIESDLRAELGLKTE
ncbi:hypothetical protein AS9A_1368 [Hoyosella subflava DQS3-9A1]|uniref:Uncharacterized protein n=1 Tax=Hoyosella subflava (strain DSM 45089 / JCM 17490 / NBRC 109087 / DQS3-9A1) TaxID=443218 RepID=F6EG95_HOYSD|nr:hypothetical protein AS9A_1368 [Hoyosella subflava DQS3-9A1]